jgi:hypothetical protein
MPNQDLAAAKSAQAESINLSRTSRPRGRPSAGSRTQAPRRRSGLHSGALIGEVQSPSGHMSPHPEEPSSGVSLGCSRSFRSILKHPSETRSCGALLGMRARKFPSSFLAHAIHPRNHAVIPDKRAAAQLRDLSEGSALCDGSRDACRAPRMTERFQGRTACSGSEDEQDLPILLRLHRSGIRDRRRLSRPRRRRRRRPRRRAEGCGRAVCSRRARSATEGHP